MDGLSIAYEVIGRGAVDILVAKVLQLPVDLMWEEPRFAKFLDRLSSFSRHVWFDSRGSGASDLISAPGRIAENYVDDMVGVLDHLGLPRAVVLGLVPDAALFAATHPERVKALVMFNPWARISRAPDFPLGLGAAEQEQGQRALEQAWGAVPTLARWTGSLGEDPRFAEWLVTCERLALPPNEGRRMLVSIAAFDIRDVLPSVSVPTLVVGRGDAATVALARDVAERVPAARFVELAGDDPFFLGGDSAGLLDVVEEFVTGRLPSPEADRVLATVLFTDLVGSTEQLARAGDRRWRELLATHDEIVGAELRRFRGKQVKLTGDGVLATFDGPGRAIGCAQAIESALRQIGLAARCGVHTGEIELRGDDIAGIAVHIGARIAAMAAEGEVLVSSSVPPLVVGSDLVFRDRGEHELKGVPGAWRLYAVE